MSTPPTYRDSLYSTDSTTTYPSTLSSQTSSLGLTESPLPPEHRTMAILEEVRDRSGELRKAAMRKASKQDLRTGTGGTRERAGKVSQRALALTAAQGVGDDSEIVQAQPKAKSPARRQPENGITQRPSRADLRIRASTPTLADRLPPVTRKAAVRSYSKANPPNVNTGTPEIAIPVRRSQPVLPGSTRLAPMKSATATSTAASSQSSMADDWEAELINDAKHLRIDARPTLKTKLSSSAPQQWPSDATPARDDWERGTIVWDVAREAGREEEDRMRKNAKREIAVRAAPSGVTSIHVGVRPRLHPSRTQESISRNQPDDSLAEPLHSPRPASEPAGTPADAVQVHSASTTHSNDKLERAQKEYETWLSRKAEREGGVGEHVGADGGGFGTTEWVPRERRQARFGQIEAESGHASLRPIQHPHPHHRAKRLQGPSDQTASQHLAIEAPFSSSQHSHDQSKHIAEHVGGLVDPQQIPHFPSYDYSLQPSSGQDGYDPNSYPYQCWDPMAYWLAMTQMGMGMGMTPGVAGEAQYDPYGTYFATGMGMGAGEDGPSPITSQESTGSSASNTSSEDDRTPRVHFAASPSQIKRHASEIDMRHQYRLDSGYDQSYDVADV